MKKIILSILLLALPMLASAYDVEIDGIYYNLNSEENTAEVTNGIYFYSGPVDIPEKFTYEGVDYSVTSIEESAFCDCTGLTSVTIPYSVTSIGKSAFAGCTDLVSVHITDLDSWCNISFGDGISNPLYFAHRLYLNGEEIKELVIPKSITNIERWVFCGCSSLLSVFIPNSVITIEEGAFFDCSCLKSVTIPNSVTRIGSRCFLGCTGLTSVTIPKSVTNIGNAAFYQCSSLTSVIIPNSVTSIGRNAFFNCTGLISVFSKMEDPCYIGSSCFPDDVFNNVTLNVPKGTIDKYKTTDYWNKFVHIIEEGESSGICLTNHEYNYTTKKLEHYDANGKIINSPQKGLNIIRMNDGTVKKVVVK